MAISSNKSVHTYTCWPLAEGKTQVPTAVLYKPQGEKRWMWTAFGQEATDEEEGLLFMNFMADLCKQVSQLTVI